MDITTCWERGGQPEWDHNDYQRDFVWLGIRRDFLMKDRMMQFFQYKHLPENLQAASIPFCNLAERLVNEYPMNPERTVALRKLLEAKDAAVRTLLYKESE